MITPFREHLCVGAGGCGEGGQEPSPKYPVCQVPFVTSDRIKLDTVVKAHQCVDQQTSWEMLSMATLHLVLKNLETTLPVSALRNGVWVMELCWVQGAPEANRALGILKVSLGLVLYHALRSLPSSPSFSLGQRVSTFLLLHPLTHFLMLW